MNTPASTPAPQKITPESRFVFPCWAYHVPSVRWVRLKTHFDIGLGIARQLLGFGYSHYAPDSETAPTCTPSEGEKPACKYCGGTGVVSYSAGGESRLDECGCGATPQPTHSAQEAAKRAAMTLVPVASPTPPYHMLEESEWHDKVARVTAIILRHFHSTPTQSQQPPVSPGSGEAPAKLDEARAQLNDVWEAMHQDPHKFKPSNPWSALAHARALEYRKVSAERNALAADFRDVAGRFCDEHRSPGSVQPGCPECARLAPPLPSIGDGKDGDWTLASDVKPSGNFFWSSGSNVSPGECCGAFGRWKDDDGWPYMKTPDGYRLEPHRVKYWMPRITPKAPDDSMSAQSPQADAGREEK
jgi:hypothetical protein